jgi:5-methyltetrahydropteroyltriglutamate--homocysteine methyltransferase
MNETLIQTTVVGSYPQPDWLVDREKLKSQSVPRVRAPDLWRIAEPFLEQAQDDATLLAIRDMERAGLDIITDGEMRRESYSNRFANSLTGIDIENPHVVTLASGRVSKLPRVIGPVVRTGPVEVRDVQFLRANTDRKIKITLPGPFTMAQQCRDDFYRDPQALTMALAEAVNAELLDLQAAGADVIQLDEPWLRNDPEAARTYAVAAINRALQGVKVTTVVHVCFGYAHLIGARKPSGYSFLGELSGTVARQISIEAAQPRLDLGVLAELPGKQIMLGVIDLNDTNIETPDAVAVRIRAALKQVTPDRLLVAPDCGMKYLPRAVAFGKLQAMCAGAAIVRREIG